MMLTIMVDWFQIGLIIIVKFSTTASFGLSTSNESGKLPYFLYFENAEGHDYLQCLSTIIGLVQWAGHKLQRGGPIDLHASV